LLYPSNFELIIYLILKFGAKPLRKVVSMQYPDYLFHLAIPCHDLDKALHFYVDILDCKLARRYSDRITLNFFENQVVCHLAPDKIDPNPQMYPRHFGITFRQKKDFDAIFERVRNAHVDFFKELFVRFQDKQEEHWTFFLCDPSNNLLEFKCYKNEEMMY
jgi:extradiol dioxygenase family protein